MPLNRPSGAAKQKIKEATPPVSAIEEAETIRSVLAELNSAYGGAYKVRPSVITSEWEGDIPNRPFSQTAVDNLIQAMRDQGILRLEPQHHAVGTMDPVTFNWLLNDVMHMTLDQVKELNSKGEYPELHYTALELCGYTI